MWRPTRYGPDDFAAFREAMDASPVEAVIIHAVYLINCATRERELRKKSLASLTHALRIGAGDRRRRGRSASGRAEGRAARPLDEARRRR